MKTPNTVEPQFGGFLRSAFAQTPMARALFFNRSIFKKVMTQQLVSPQKSAQVGREQKHSMIPSWASLSSLCALLAVSATSLSAQSNAARSALSGGEVFLGGKYIELGVSARGSFGTTGSKPSGFFGAGSSANIGMGSDIDGYGVGSDLRIDYFVPGFAEERWAVGFKESGSVYNGGFSQLRGNRGNLSLVGNSVVNESSGTTLTARFVGTLQKSGVNWVKVTQVHTFSELDSGYKTTVTLENLSGAPISDLRFMRSFDPDNTVFFSGGGSYTTTNQIVSTYSSSGQTLVTARNTETDTAYTLAAGSRSLVGFFSTDSNSYGFFGGFAESNPFSIGGVDPVSSPKAAGSGAQADQAIQIVFNLGTLATGASSTFEYLTALSQAAAASAVGNSAPVASAVTASTAEDTANEITLIASDADGNSLAYSIVAGPSSSMGTLGAVVGNKVTFTPTANFSGTATFTFKANDGTVDSNTETVTVTVTAVNDAPTLTTPTAITLTDTANNDSFTDQTGTLVGADIDSSTLDYGITGGTVASGKSTKVGTYGTLEVNTSSGAYTFVANATAINALSASTSETYEVTVGDGATPTLSAAANLVVNLTAANDTPTLATPAAITLIDTAASDTFADSTGTLTGGDRDTGTTLAYGITGGTVPPASPPR
jgi:VCBS repeat-containing protein